MNESSEVDQYLMSVVDIFKKNASNLVNPLQLEKVSIEEYEQAFSHPGTKHIDGIGGGLAGEPIHRSGFTRCVPIFLRDNLNEYATGIHLNANEGGFSPHQSSYLESYAPKGLYNVVIINRDFSFQSANNTKHQLMKLKKDIFNVHVLDIPGTHHWYSAGYNPRNDEIFVRIEGNDFAYKTSGLDLQVLNNLPELLPLSLNLRRNFAETFRM